MQNNSNTYRNLFRRLRRLPWQIDETDTTARALEHFSIAPSSCQSPAPQTTIELQRAIRARNIDILRREVSGALNYADYFSSEFHNLYALDECTYEDKFEHEPRYGQPPLEAKEMAAIAPTQLKFLVFLFELYDELSAAQMDALMDFVYDTAACMGRVLEETRLIEENESATGVDSGESEPLVGDLKTVAYTDETPPGYERLMDMEE
jgi:hypothetical protein